MSAVSMPLPMRRRWASRGTVKSNVDAEPGVEAVHLVWIATRVAGDPGPANDVIARRVRVPVDPEPCL